MLAICNGLVYSNLRYASYARSRQSGVPKRKEDWPNDHEPKRHVAFCSRQTQSSINDRTYEEEHDMPLWKVYHPVGAFSAEDKRNLAKQVTDVYARIPIPKFYVVFIYEEMAKDSCFVGGEPNNKFVRFKIDHIARTLPGSVLREWWIRTLDTVIAPYVKDKGYDWEISVDETPVDLWSLQGEIAPPFESVAEKRWVKENKASPYTLAEKIPVNLILAPGVADR
jgi:phenylpyruvate tautomerase PptA (4-oxalocrotonate tautomerase family)